MYKTIIIILSIIVVIFSLGLNKNSYNRIIIYLTKVGFTIKDEYRISIFFPCHKNLQISGKCMISFICIGQFLAILKFVIANNIRYIFCVLDNLRCKNDCKNTKSWIIAKITGYTLLRYCLNKGYK